MQELKIKLNAWYTSERESSNDNYLLIKHIESPFH